MSEKIKILVVDDAEVMRNLLTGVLTDAGYEVKAVSTGEKAVGEIKEDNYDVVITDLKMPGMNGLEVIKETKQINKDICIIAITAYPSVKSAVEAMREGAYDYITKPFDIEEIKLVVHRVAERYFLLKQVGRKGFYRELPILDNLTGIYNHRHFHEVLPREIERAKRYSQPFCLLMIDIDDFKKYNDTHGHLAGDKLLTNIANLLIASMRSADIVFRYGGEEFVVILPQVGKQAGVSSAKRILELIKQKLSVTVSIGVTSFSDDGASKDKLINQADSAMYQAKKLGKDRICVFGEKDEK